jgi:hypothetical protein
MVHRVAGLLQRTRSFGSRARSFGGVIANLADRCVQPPVFDSYPFLRLMVASAWPLSERMAVAHARLRENFEPPPG